MNKTVFNFPKAHTITCTWIETGDPRHPLVRRWIDTNGNTPATTDDGGLRLCA